MSYEVKIVERDGSFVRSVVGANVISITDPLDDHEQATWTFPKHDPASAPGQGADIQALQREVQIWRNGSIYFWGAIVNASATSSDGAIRMTSPGVSWYFSRENIDKPRKNLLLNPEFESGLTDWNAINTADTVVASPRRLGANSLRLDSTVDGADAFEEQNISWTATAIGDLVTLAGWLYIDTWVAPALESRGLYVEGTVAGVVKQTNTAVVDASTPRNQWVRLETTIWIPPGETWNLNVRVYSPHGVVYWDAVELVLMESLSSSPDGTDIATLAAMIVQFIQDDSEGLKSDLFIGTDTPLTGITLIKAWQFTEHTPAEVALDELVALGLDWSMVVTSTTKTFTTYSPRKGTDRTSTVTLTFGNGNQISSYSYSENGDQTETKTTYFGDGDGPDREEGMALDASDLGGLILEGVYQAPPGTGIDTLPALAADRNARTKRLVKIPKVTTVQNAGDLVSLLKTGDQVLVAIDDGWVQVPALPYRIVKKELIARTDTLELTFNEE